MPARLSGWVFYFNNSLFMRDSSIFYRSFYEAIKELPTNNQEELYTAIFEYSLNFNEVELTGLSKTIFTLIKPQLEANNKRFESGNIPKNKRTGSKDEAKEKQDVSELEANNNVNNNNNVNENVNNNIISDKSPKKKTFKNLSENEFIEELRTFENLFDKNLLNDFFKYWKELSPGGKMKFQLEKTWETKLRLEKWKSNQNKFNQNGHSTGNKNIGRSIEFDAI